MFKQLLLTVLVSSSLLVTPRAQAFAAAGAGVVWVPVVMGLSVFGAIEIPAALLYFTQKIETESFLSSVFFATAAGGLAFNETTGQQEFGAINPSLAQRAGMTKNEVSSFNNELPLINGLFQSAEVAAAQSGQPETAKTYLQQNKSAISPDAQSALGKYYRFLVASK